MKFWIRCEAFFSERPHFGPHWIGIQQGKIVAIRDSQPVDSSDPVINTSNCYLFPLMSDTHVHCYMNPWPLNPAERIRPGSGEFEDEVQAGLKRLGKALSSGMGLIRDMGDPLGINLEIRNRIARTPEDYPALQVSGSAIHRPGKYGRLLGVSRKSLADILTLIDQLAEEKRVNFIKVVSTGIVDFSRRCMNQEPQFSAKELTTIVEHAGQHGLRVASHCSGADGIDINLDSGVQFIEHAYFIRPDQIERMKDLGTWWTPTFSPVCQQVANDQCGWDASSRRYMYKMLDDHNTSLQLAKRRGVKVLAGTDAGSPGCELGNGINVERDCLARSIPLQDVLKMLTADNADACAHPEYTGRIRVGDPASFALYSSAPWQNPSLLGHPAQVYNHGKATLPQDNN